MSPIPCERRAWYDFEPRPGVFNVTVKRGMFRKTPRTPEYIAMIENIERVEPLPPTLGDTIERIKAQMVERLTEQIAEGTMRLFSGYTLPSYQREAIAALERGERVFYTGGKIRS